ncbi:hypothetical protein NDU88_006939 [Pleurodeles waltl]|uniref:Beta/gamma crystallin 'Greek key' domain-containing protein n=1 Tax=Pleurodeles waltl TaxID=8319 RepID=A0AAV7WC13_PLEWA|nr:hypothetical protein NDU88_006937 [Pleurodeles waltl]KAJ1211581.1 hypothetical protein NDU88_006939 [Pleurodeles waltl]
MPLSVSGDPWVVFTEKDYKASYKLFQAGDHPYIGDFANNISSVRVVKDGLGDPQITLYGGKGYHGKEVTLIADTPTLTPLGMEKKTASLKVTKGAWQLFDADNYEGGGKVVLSGDDLLDLQPFHWAGRVCSLKPYQE